MLFISVDVGNNDNDAEMTISFIKKENDLLILIKVNMLDLQIYFCIYCQNIIILNYLT